MPTHRILASLYINAPDIHAAVQAATRYLEASFLLPNWGSITAVDVEDQQAEECPPAQAEDGTMPKALKDGDYTLADGAAWIAVDGLAVRLSRIPGGVGYDGKLLIAPYLEIAVYRDGHDLRIHSAEMEEPIRLIEVPFPNP